MATHPIRFRGGRGAPKFPQASPDRTDGDPGCPRDGRDPAMAGRPRFSRGQQAAFTFVQMRRQRRETITDRSEIDHLPKIGATPIPWNRPFPRTLNRVAYFRTGP